MSVTGRAAVADRLDRLDRLDRIDPEVRHALRRVLVVVLLLPLLVLLAAQTPRLLKAPLLLGYGFLALATTCALLFIAYTRYQDPALGSPAPRRRAGPFPTLPDRPRVSFLLAVRNEQDGIEACVRSMAASDLPDVRITVVDDASTDGTPDVLTRLAAELPLRVVFLTENVGKKRALLRAAEHADGDVLAFTDSDCVLAPDALRRCVTALANHPELGAVSGHARASNADHSLLTRVQDVWYEGQFRVAKAAEAAFGAVTCVSGPLAVFRREAVWNYLPAWAEDRFLGREFRFATDRQLTGYVLGQRAVGARLKRRHADSPFVRGVDHPELPWRTGYVRSAAVWTAVPSRFRSLLRQQVRWKKSFIRNVFFTGTFVWRRGLGAAALYYGHVAWVVAAPVMALWHLVWAPATGLWALTGLYLAGVTLKGVVWGLAFRIDNPGTSRWRYRPLMSLLSATTLAWLLPYSLATIRRGVWFRDPR